MKYMMSRGRVKSLPTLPVTSCDGCGACCRHMGTPPGYAAYYPYEGELAAWAKESPDYERWKNLPAAVEADLRAYYDAVKAGTLLDRTTELPDVDAVIAAVKAGRLDVAMKEIMNKARPDAAIPCLWFDSDTKRCRHYEHRPETCRDPEVMSPGNPACLATRSAFRIPLPLAAPEAGG